MWEFIINQHCFFKIYQKIFESLETIITTAGKLSNSEKLVGKILPAISETFLDENNCNYNSYKLSYRSAFIFFLSFVETEIKNPIFRKLVVC